MIKLFGNILYYPGCMMKFVTKEQNEKYKKILRKLGIDFVELKEIEVCCGSPAHSSGYEKLVKKLAKKNFKVFKEHAIKKIITPCPACFRFFSQEYKKILPKWDIKSEHITQTIFKILKGKELKIMKKKITYHDPCHLGRYAGIYDEPREIIKILGGKLLEMEMNRENSLCCGGGGGVRANFPELSNEIAKSRIKQAKKTKAKILLTTCPLCYFQLNEVAKKIKVMELSDFLSECL